MLIHFKPYLMIQMLNSIANLVFMKNHSMSKIILKWKWDVHF